MNEGCVRVQPAFRSPEIHRTFGRVHSCNTERQEPRAPWRTPFRRRTARVRRVRRRPVTKSLTPKRLFILGLVVALSVSYLGSARDYLAQRNELGRQQVALGAMRTERDTIHARLKSLDNPAVIEARARELGYTKLGELPLRVTGLELTPPAAVVRRDHGGFWDFLPDIF